MSQTNSSSRLAPWQAMTMLAVGIAIIFFGLMALKVNARIVLAVDGAIMCLNRFRSGDFPVINGIKKCR